LFFDVLDGGAVLLVFIEALQCLHALTNKGFLREGPHLQRIEFGKVRHQEQATFQVIDGGSTLFVSCRHEKGKVALQVGFQKGSHLCGGVMAETVNNA
jgi:hypothetical protein